MFKSLRFRLSVIFIGLAIGPLLLTALFLTRHSISYLERQSQTMLDEVANRVVNEIKFFVEDQVNDFNLIHTLYGVELFSPEKQKIIFSNLLFQQQIYQNISLFTPAGKELLRLSRSEIFTDKDLRDRPHELEFQFTSAYKHPHFSSINFDRKIQEPLITISIPLFDLRNGELVNVFTGDIRFKRIWNLLANITIPGKGLVYVVDQKKRVVAHRNPSVVLSGTIVNLPEIEGRAKGLSGTDSIISWQVLELGDQKLSIVVEQPVSQAFVLVKKHSQIAAAITSLFLVIAVILIMRAIRYAIRPIESMATAAQAISRGDYSQHIEVTSKDELGDLASSFNMMSRDLEQYNCNMEELVKTRTLELMEQKKQLQAITENVPGVVFQFYVSNTGETGIHYISSKLYDIFGLDFIDDPSVYFQTFTRNIHEEDRQSWLDSIQHAVEKQIPWFWKGRYVKPSEEIIWFEEQSTPTVRKNEIVFDGILIDITEKTELEAQKLESRLQKEQLNKIESLKTMAGAIAHRFNNAMMGVQGNLDLLKHALPADSKEHKMAYDAAQAARGASHVGSMMLSYVGQRPLKLQEIPLAVLVRESVTTVKSLLLPSISLQFNPPDQQLYCSIDQHQIKEVIESILSNALESLDDSVGTIEITFGSAYFTVNSLPVPFQNDDLQDGMYTFCQIRDTGHGITPENLSRIFDPFYTTRFVGRGLGLALTVGIMRSHNGAIIVESALDKETTVRVLFPSISPTRQPISSSDSGQKETVQLSGNILLADDEKMIFDVG